MASGRAWEGVRAGRLRAAIDELCASHIDAFREHLPELRELFARWYAAHPFEVVWSRDYNFCVVDPLGLTTDDTIVGEDVPRLRPWATLLRTCKIAVGGPHVFHHGCDLEALLVVLRDPSLPRRIHSFALPPMDNYPAHEIDELVTVMVNEPCFAELEHLAIKTALPLEPRHLERLAAAPWAGGLRTLDDPPLDRPRSQGRRLARAAGHDEVVAELARVLLRRRTGAKRPGLGPRAGGVVSGLSARPARHRRIPEAYVMAGERRKPAGRSRVGCHLDAASPRPWRSRLPCPCDQRPCDRRGALHRQPTSKPLLLAALCRRLKAVAG